MCCHRTPDCAWLLKLLKFLQDVIQESGKKHSSSVFVQTKCAIVRKINMAELGAPNGIHLLDEFRRYSITGKHSDIRMRTTSGTNLRTVNDAHFHWIKDTFRDVANTHELSPNVEAHTVK